MDRRPMNVVVTGGGTIAPIDDVRHIANTSTGQFSAQITEALLRRGATVWHVHGPAAVLPFQGQRLLSLTDSDLDREFARLGSLRGEIEAHRSRLQCRDIGSGTVAGYAQTLREVLLAQPIDIAILAMAVSDYEPDRVVGKVSSDRDEWTLTLHPTPKVIRSVRGWAPDVFLVGFKLLFAASDDVLIAAARDACKGNRADLTVANDLLEKQRGLHKVHVVDRERLIETIGPGGPIADRLMDRILTEFAGSRRSGVGR